MLMLLGMTVNALVVSLDSLWSARSIHVSINKSLEVAELVRNLQIERGRTSMFLSSNRTNMLVFDKLLQSRSNTDYAAQFVSDWSFVDIVYLRNYTDPRNVAFMKFMGTFRNMADIGRVPVTTSNHFFTDLNVALLGTLFRDVTAPSQYKYLVAFDNFGRASDKAGVQRAVAAAFWLPCDYEKENWLWLVETHSDHKTLLEASYRYHPALEDSYKRVIFGRENLWWDIEDMVTYLTDSNFRKNCRSNPTEWRLSMGLHWFNNMTLYINLLSEVRTTLVSSLSLSLESEIDKAFMEVRKQFLSFTVRLTRESLIKLLWEQIIFIRERS